MDGGDVIVYETNLRPVLQELEELQEFLGEQFQQFHVELLQLQTGVDLIFLAVGLTAGILLGCVVGFMICRMWGS